MLCTTCNTEREESEFWNDGRRGGKLKPCKVCKRAYMRRYRRKNPDLDKQRYQKDPAAEQERRLIRKYGITLADYDRMFAEQGGRCAICDREHDGGKRFDVDHDHETGDVRGLLCTNCNRMIGHAHDDPRRLRDAARYLETSCRK